MQVQSLGWKNPLEKGMATLSSILAWRILDRESWRATVHRVAQSWTRLKRLSTHACFVNSHCQSQASVATLSVQLETGQSCRKAYPVVLQTQVLTPEVPTVRLLPILQQDAFGLRSFSKQHNGIMKKKKKQKQINKPFLTDVLLPSASHDSYGKMKNYLLNSLIICIFWGRQGKVQLSFSIYEVLLPGPPLPWIPKSARAQVQCIKWYGCRTHGHQELTMFLPNESNAVVKLPEFFNSMVNLTHTDHAAIF